MAHTSVDVRIEMGDWPGRTGGAPVHAALFGLHVPRLSNTNLGFPFRSASNSCPRATAFSRWRRLAAIWRPWDVKDSHPGDAVVIAPVSSQIPC
jgi:hypothetical protein